MTKEKIDSDEEFLKRMAKIRNNAEKKAKLNSEKNVKEYEEGLKQGKETGIVFSELDKCYKIIEEFKKNPPLIISKHINSVSVEYRYDDKYKEKVALLKKHHFSFLSIVHDTSIFTPHFKTFGRAYVKRGMQKILLPDTSLAPIIQGNGMGSKALDPNNPGFILENGDTIQTENNSYVVLNDFISNDDYRREICIFPNSEMTINLSKKITNPKPGFMVPSQVPEIIKRESKNTVISYNILNYSLIKGIFKVDLINKNSNANGLLKINSKYPDIEFIHSSKTFESILDKEYAKLANVPNAAQIVANYNTQKIKNSKKCDTISTHIELCNNNSIVVFGTMNSIKHKSTGKIASVKLPTGATRDFVLPGKITIMDNRIYSDQSNHVDPRAKAIIKYGNSIEVYNSMLQTIKEFEMKLKKAKEKKNQPKKPLSVETIKEKEKRKKELLEEMNYLKKSGDTEMARAVQMQIDEIDTPSTENEGINEELIIQTIARLNKELDRLRPDINSNFPEYNSVSESDLI
jgi:hypothetical protein